MAASAIFGWATSSSAEENWQAGGTPNLLPAALRREAEGSATAYDLQPVGAQLGVGGVFQSPVAGAYDNCGDGMVCHQLNSELGWSPGLGN